MINIIPPNKFIKDNKFKGPVTSSQLFLGKSGTYHPQGLFSEEIFGIDGSKERSKNMSWIDLNCQVIHPVLYDIIRKRIDRKIVKLLSGETVFSLDNTGRLVEDKEGEIKGMSSYIEHIRHIRFRSDFEESGDDDEDLLPTDRDKIINMLYTHIKQGTFFIDKLIIISPDFRPHTIMQTTGANRLDPINDIYKSIIEVSNQLKNVSGSLYDIFSYKMQNLMVDVYEYIRSKTAKKHGIIRNLMLGKRMDYSARTVITPNPKLTIGDVGVPFRIICQIFEPHIIYGVINSPYADSLPQEFHDEVKKYLGREASDMSLVV